MGIEGRGIDWRGTPYFTGNGYWNSEGRSDPSILGHRKVLFFRAYPSPFHDEEYTEVSMRLHCETEEKDMAHRLDEIIGILQEWKSMLVEPNLSGNEPGISRNWERLPHESDNRSNGSANTLGGA